MALSERAQQAIKEKIGQAEDNLHRAKHAARGMTAEGKNPAREEWGQSGVTLQSIIDDYQEDLDAWKAELQ